MSHRNTLMIGILSVVIAGAGAAARAQEGGPGAAHLSPQDFMEIQQLYARYNQTIDAGDHKGWAETFTDDGALGTTKGHEALMKTSANWRDNRNGSHMRHWNNNLMIKSVTAEGVRASVYLVVMDHTTLQQFQTGVYDDLIVKTPKGWLFKQRNLKSDPKPKPAAQ